MIHYLFKKIRNGKKSRTWYGRYKLDWMPKAKDINLGVTEKQVAEAKLRRIIKELQQEKEGLISPESIRNAAKMKIEIHLDDFIKDLQTLGRASHYVNVLKSSILTVCNLNSAGM